MTKDDAEELVRDWANFHPDIPLTPKYKDLTRRITAYANQRDAEVREVLEGLATYRNPQCWCPPDTETEPHSEACRAATALYTKLQRKEVGDADDKTVSR